MTRVLITGGAGLLGQALVRCAPAEAEIHATWRTTALVLGRGDAVDLVDAAAVGELVDRFRPDVVVHTAYTQSSEADIVTATANIAAAVSGCDARLVHLSSDCVFGGENGPYAETDEPDGPPDDYGRWKAQVERRVTELVPGAAVVRTSLLTAVDPPDPRTAAVIDGLTDGADVGLFVEELRCPVAVDDVAEAMWRMVALPPLEFAGVWHLAGEEAVSRYTLGVLTAASFGLDPAGIRAATYADHARPRSRDVRLSIGRAKREIGFQPRTMAELFTGKTGHI